MSRKPVGLFRAQFRQRYFATTRGDKLMRSHAVLKTLSELVGIAVAATFKSFNFQLTFTLPPIVAW